MRRQETWVVERDGRDKGGVFEIEELPAFQATEWFVRALQLFARAGVDVPPGIVEMGPVGFITVGIGSVLTGLGKAPWADVKPLLDELLACVKSYQPPGGTQPITSWNTIKQQIQEPSTVIMLYEKVISVHLGFSISGALSNFRGILTTMNAPGQSTETSQET